MTIRARAHRIAGDGKGDTVLRWFRRPSEGTIQRLDDDALEAILLAFECRYRAATGRLLPSMELYEYYRAGEVDDPFTTAWATYYAALLRMRGPTAVPGRQDGFPPPWAQELVDEARPPVVVG
jgi:hypothetical protein